MAPATTDKAGFDPDAAERWAIRRDAGPLAPAEQAALDAWLAEDARHHGALLRAEAVLAWLDRGRALAGESEAAPVAMPTVPEPDFTATDRRSLIAAGLAAGIVATAGGGAWLWSTRPRQIETALGEVRRVPLDDGSVAAVNTASLIAVSYAPDRRVVELRDGEAWFQVAKDKARPFVVEAGAVRVQAVGTAFSVRRRPATADQPAGAEVLVTEGVVETWVEGQPGPRTRIAAGAKGFVPDPGTSGRAGAEPAPQLARVEVEHAPGEIDRRLSWRNGELALNGETLAYAVAEINRYNARKLVLVDGPAPDGARPLARETLVGYFRTTEPENFGRAVADMVGAKVREDGREIRIERR